MTQQNPPQSSDMSDLEGFLRSPQLQPPSDNELYEITRLLASMQMECDRFNWSAQFLNSGIDDEHSQKLAVRARNTSGRAKDCLLEAKAALQKVLAQLCNDVDQFETNLPQCTDPMWYRNFDITAFDARQLKQAVFKLPIPNISDFSAYLEHVIAVQAVRHDERDWNGKTFAESIGHLIRFVCEKDTPTFRAAFSLLVEAKVKLAVTSQNRIADQAALLALAEQIDKELQGTLDKPLHKYIGKQYYDFPSKWRAVVDAGMDCIPTVTPLISLLDRLGVQAVSEIRSRTMIAVGNRLPAEIYEVMVEQAILFEEIPVEYVESNTAQQTNP